MQHWRLSLEADEGIRTKLPTVEEFDLMILGVAHRFKFLSMSCP